MKKVIEITGPAGVGKSFLCKNLCSYLGGTEQKKSSIFYLPLIKSLTIIPFLFFLTRDRFRIYFIFLIKLAKWKIIKNKKQGIYIIDEGPWHFLCGSLLPRASNERRQALLKHWKVFMDLPDVIIYLKAEPEYIWSRRKMRNGKKEKTLDIREIKTAIDYFESNLNVTKNLYSGVEFFVYKIDDDFSTDLLSESIRKLYDNSIEGSHLKYEVNIYT